jgi:hypothetical protein
MLKHLVLALAVLAGLSGAMVAAAGIGATPAAACEAHTS